MTLEVPRVRSAVRFTDSIQLAPDNALAQNNLGLVLDRMNDVPGAIARFERAVELEPGSSHYFNNLGYSYYRKGDLNPAIASLRESLRLNSNFPRAQANLAQVMERRSGKVEVELAPEPRLKK